MSTMLVSVGKQLPESFLIDFFGVNVAGSDFIFIIIFFIGMGIYAVLSVLSRLNRAFGNELFTEMSENTLLIKKLEFSFMKLYSVIIFNCLIYRLYLMIRTIADYEIADTIIISTLIISVITLIIFQIFLKTKINKPAKNN